jgi:diguanylate cyclase (GGDEF)-like protein/PAS domain S-box-containing protein
MLLSSNQPSEAAAMTTHHTRFIALVTINYIVLGAAWVLLSDQILPLVHPDTALWLSSSKGVFFVLATAVGYLLALRAVDSGGATRQPMQELAVGGLHPVSGSGWYNYPLALLLVGAMLLVRTHLDGANVPPLLILFMLPIVISALLGGLGPGLLATGASALGVKLAVLPPLYSLHFQNPYEMIQWGVLMVNGAVVSVLSEFMRSALRKSASDRRLLSNVINGTSDAVFVKDLQGRYLLVNRATAEFLNRPAEEILGRSDDMLFPPESAARVRREDRMVMASGYTQTHEEHLRLPNGRLALFLATKGPIYDGAGQAVGIFGISRDVTERKLAEERIEHLAHFDVLTGLPNRVQLEEHARQALQRAQGAGRQLALLFLDLDRFKDINDSLGHSVGDALLVRLARRLRLAQGGEDLLARHGGDEFIFLLQCDDPASVQATAQKILEMVAEPFAVGEHELSVTASIGMAVFPQDGRDLETLVRCADAAMYQAKQNGRSRSCFFTSDLEEQALRRLQIVSALRHALEHEELSIVYQPQFDARDGHIVGAEALLRWQHPVLGAVSPAEFIPAAEYSSLILPIGEWVLRQAVRQMKRWLDLGMEPFVMAVNLSAAQFRHPDLPQLVSSILVQEQLAPHYLELELTEGTAMHDPPQAIAVMDRLHERGVRMAIDDFGIAYSSLSYLKKFKIYKLKIDQSFVRDICTDPEDRAIVAAIINLARSLGLRTIAEGVEHPAQLDYLREQGCDEVQGFCYSRPLSAAQFEVYAFERAQRVA